MKRKRSTTWRGPGKVQRWLFRRWLRDYGALPPRWLRWWWFLLYGRWWRPPPSFFAPLPRWQDRLRRNLAWRRADGVQRWSMTKYHWEKVCAGCRRWMAPTDKEYWRSMIVSGPAFTARYYHYRCYRRLSQQATTPVAVTAEPSGSEAGAVLP